MARLVECVPNFSEGRDPAVIDGITAAIDSVEGVTLLDVDPGKATNRTVVTFVGEPEDVVEAAVRAGQAAAELIDMSVHHGEHPRFGSMDVCPLVPVAGITMEETVPYAHEIARRLGEEVGLTVYCYEHAAKQPGRRNLAHVRAGEYEGLKERLEDPASNPDYGPAEFNTRSGATAVGAREFLVAYNVNLNTTSTRRANAVAFDVREKGRLLREPALTGQVQRDANGDPIWVPGSLVGVKGIGWFIEEYGIAQISMNITDITVTPFHVAFDEVCRRAEARGMRVTGSELVGLIPLEAMLEAGRYFLRKQQRSTGVSDDELIKIAVRTMGLDELGPFDPKKKIIEYAVRPTGAVRLVDLSVEGFTEETASESPAPGGGSVSASVGALGAALGTMVANLSSHKRGWDDKWESYSDVAEAGKACYVELLALVDADTDAFNAIMAAWKAEPDVRAARIEEATEEAIRVPLRVMAVAVESMAVAQQMAETGMAASASDVGVGVLCARTAVRGAWLNVKINAKDLKEEEAKRGFLAAGEALLDAAARLEEEVLRVVESRM